MSIYISLLAALLGLLLYAFAANPKIAEIGRLLFFAGSLAFLLQLGPQMTQLLGGGK